jgi:hypothetical protein
MVGGNQKDSSARLLRLSGCGIASWAANHVATALGRRLSWGIYHVGIVRYRLVNPFGRKLNRRRVIAFRLHGTREDAASLN